MNTDCTMPCEAYKNLQAENERLRQALEEIEDCGNKYCVTCKHFKGGRGTVQPHVCFTRIAIQALKGGE